MLAELAQAFFSGAFNFLFQYLGSFQPKTTEVVQDDPNAPIFVSVNDAFDDLGLR